MLKKLICCISAISLLLSVIIPTSVFSVAATDYKAASGNNLLYGFDDATDISSQKWKTRWDNGGTAMQIALETNSANVYGGSGKSIKVTYDTSKKETSNPSPAIWLDTTAITTSGDGITFWIKSEKATKIRIVAADKSYAKTLTIDGVEVKAGENLFFFKYSDFNNSSSADMSKLNQFQIRTDGNDAGTFYFDNFGFFSENDSDNQEEDWKKDLKAASGSNLLFGFDDITNSSQAKWTARFDNNGTAIKVDLETNASNVYGGSGKSLKVTYDCANKVSSGVPAIWTGDTLYTPKGDGITFWIKSEKATKIKLVMGDKSYKAMVIDNIEVKAGENLFFFRYSDFTNYSSADLSGIRQIQIRTAADDANTFYFDNFGFFSLSGDDDKEDEKEEDEDWAKDLTAATGDNLLDSFDDVTDLSTQKWKPRWDNSGTALQMSLETSADNVYGGSGKSIKIVYDSAKKQAEGPPSIWAGDNGFVPQGDGITFWIKSEKATTIKLVTADSTFNVTMIIDNIEVKAGENLYFFRYSDFSNYASANMSRLRQFQIRTAGNDAGTLYFDNFGFFELPKKPEPEVLEGTLEVLWDFDDYTTVASMNNAWQPHLAGPTGEGIRLAIEDAAENVYSGIGKSLKVEYDRTKGTDTLPCIRHVGNITTKGEGLIFWIKSAEDTKINFVGVDKNDKTVKTNPIDIVKGENIVVIKYSDIFLSSGSGTADLSVLKQLQIRPAGNNKTGTYWLDAFGFYAPAAIHDDDFFEFEIDGSKWTKNNTSTATYAYVREAEHYHKGITDVKDNQAALKVSYSNLSANNTNSIYYNAAIRISDTEPYNYGEDTVLSFWIFSEQEVKLNVLYSDKDSENKDVLSATKELIIPAGESIVRIPMKELVKSGTSPIYKRVYQLQFRFFSSAGTVNAAEGNVWIDAIGFYDSNPDTNTQPQNLENAFVWWDFDDDKSVEDCGWSARWPGEDGKGITISLDNDPQNTYGGEGQSLKAVYKAAESDNSQPTVWIGDTRITAFGEGITFWIKSQNQTKIRLVALDGNNSAVVTNYIPLKIGENIVTVKWDNFFVSNEPDKETNMSSVSQLQIRAGIKDSNTVWIDSISFYNIKDDGSNSYYSLNPPESYDNWYDGVSVVGQDFESYPGDDDMQFCCDWYFDSAGWIALENDLGNTRLRMDYDFTKNVSSILTNITSYKGVDPLGGISFWAKSSIERYYTLKVWLGQNTAAVVVFKADTKGRYYKIPFSSFWLNNKVNINYSPSSSGTLEVPKITISSDATSSPPALGNSDKFSLWIDDIKFVDSAQYKRAGEVDHYENGVRLRADKDAFVSGVYPSIKVVDVTESQKTSYLDAMKGADTFINLFQIDAFDNNNVSLVPQKAVELTFDVPEGIDPQKVSLYQLFIDGSMTKRSVTVTEDGKVRASVYRLGSYVLGYGNGKDNAVSDDTAIPQTRDNIANTMNILLIVNIASMVCAVLAGISFRRKERQSK